MPTGPSAKTVSAVPPAMDIPKSSTYKVTTRSPKRRIIVARAAPSAPITAFAVTNAASMPTVAKGILTTPPTTLKL